jgi:hypothetical protein
MIIVDLGFSLTIKEYSPSLTPPAIFTTSSCLTGLEGVNLKV